MTDSPFQHQSVDPMLKDIRKELAEVEAEIRHYEKSHHDFETMEARAKIFKPENEKLREELVHMLRNDKELDDKVFEDSLTKILNKDFPEEAPPPASGGTATAPKT